MEKIIYSLVSVKKQSDQLNTMLAGQKGIAGTNLQHIPFEETSAIVSDLNRASLVADESTAIEYAAVIETLFQEFTLLPMRFGSFMESDEGIVQMLERNYQEITQNLLKVENRYEFGLKVFCNPELVLENLRIKSETMVDTPKRPLSEIKDSNVRAWIDKKLKENRLEDMLVSYVDSIIAEINEQLSKLNAISKIKKMVTPTTIIDGVFLIEKEFKDALIQAGSHLKNKYPTLTIIITGPWPPYNFVNFAVK